MLEVADIFRDHGAAWREANRGHVSLGQLKVMSAIERCRTAALGGHVARCENEGCGHTIVAFNSCRNRHCPKCQGSAAREWLAERQAELLPVPYFHVVFTLPAPIASIAYQNKAAIYGILFKASAETMLRIAADPKHLGARIGITSVLHTWGSAMTHHPHVHMIVPGGGLSQDGQRWIAGRPDYLLPVPVLSQLFRGRMLSTLLEAHGEGRLKFSGEHAPLADKKAFKAFLKPLWNCDWVVYAKKPFSGPEAVLAYLARYTHRVAISNSRLIAANADGVTFKYKDYRVEGPERYKTMTLSPHEFIRRFLLHVLPRGFMRIRHYGILANRHREPKLRRCRELLGVPTPLPPQPPLTVPDPDPQRAAPDERDTERPLPPCPICGAPMRIVEILTPRPWDTS
jgi:Putative transposase/Transposase zinc-binding domain